MFPRLGLFAESLLVGVLTALAALLVVPALAAVAAGCSVLRESRTGPAGLALFAVRLREALCAGPPVLLLPPAAVAVLLVGHGAAGAGLPGAQAWSAAATVAVTAAAAALLRIVACWRPGMDWRGAARAGADRITGDLHGSALVVLAVVAAAVIATAVPVMAPLVLGQALLAAAAVEVRAEGREAVRTTG
ncbi:hypothetical protein DFP74_3599 [Nocardiopsis sp. Huas11]|uniref:hypothetical protein n=1 Tax=Nocardiopsis sp. Huas11 TaxID=2183912 RepID=UPI000EADEA65|nr:hypothetical protein [Nocardiopsis sp. Huas11]RKS07911.1 hypothetical protein DFP74_3599 [Nocardiopsis sp. Huas11]